MCERVREIAVCFPLLRYGAKGEPRQSQSSGRPTSGAPRPPARALPCPCALRLARRGTCWWRRPRAVRRFRSEAPLQRLRAAARGLRGAVSAARGRPGAVRRRRRAWPARAARAVRRWRAVALGQAGPRTRRCGMVSQGSLGGALGKFGDCSAHTPRRGVRRGGFGHLPCAFCWRRGRRADEATASGAAEGSVTAAFAAPSKPAGGGCPVGAADIVPPGRAGWVRTFAGRFGRPGFRERWLTSHFSIGLKMAIFAFCSDVGGWKAPKGTF